MQHKEEKHRLNQVQSLTNSANYCRSCSSQCFLLTLHQLSMPLLFQLAEFSLSPFVILLDAGKRLLPSNCCGSRCHSTWCSWDHQESGMNGVALNQIRVYGWLQCRQRVQGAYTVKNIAGWFFPFFFQLLFFTDLQPDSFPSIRLVIRWVCQGQKNSWSLVSHWNVLYRSSDISKLRSKSL